MLKISPENITAAQKGYGQRKIYSRHCQHEKVMSLGKMVQQYPTGNHNRQSQEKPGAVKLPQVGVVQKVDSLHILPAAVPEDKKDLDYSQDYTSYDEYRRPKSTFLQLTGLDDKLQTAAEQHDPADIPHSRC